MWVVQHRTTWTWISKQQSAIITTHRRRRPVAQYQELRKLICPRALYKIKSSSIELVFFHREKLNLRKHRTHKGKDDIDFEKDENTESNETNNLSFIFLFSFILLARFFELFLLKFKDSLSRFDSSPSISKNANSFSFHRFVSRSTRFLFEYSLFLVVRSLRYCCCCFCCHWTFVIFFFCLFHFFLIDSSSVSFSLLGFVRSSSLTFDFLRKSSKLFRFFSLFKTNIFLLFSLFEPISFNQFIGFLKRERTFLGHGFIPWMANSTQRCSQQVHVNASFVQENWTIIDAQWKRTCWTIDNI